MPTIDTSIAQSFRPVQIESPVNQMANLYQLQAAQQANQLNAMKMAAAQRAETETQGLNELYKNAVTPEGHIDYEKLQREMAAKGFGSQVPGLIKTQREQQKADFEAQKAKGELIDQRLKRSREFLDTIDPTAPDAAQRYLAWHSANHADSVLGPYLQSMGADQQQAFQQINQAINKGTLPQLIEQSKLGVTKVQEMRQPKPQTVDLHDRSVVIDINPHSPTFMQQLTSQKKGISEHEQFMQNMRAQEVAEQKRSHKATEAQAGQVLTDEKGNVTVLDKSGKPMATYTGAGKPSAAFSKTQAQQKQMQNDLGFAIKELKDAAKNGGLIDQSTGSGAGRLYDYGARFFGEATPGDIAIGKLQPIADLALKMVPRFEGPQSDKDTKSYKEAAGQLADATMPNKIRKEAAKTVVRLMEARKNQFVTQDMASGNTAVPEGAAPPTGFVLDR